MDCIGYGFFKSSTYFSFLMDNHLKGEFQFSYSSYIINDVVLVMHRAGIGGGLVVARHGANMLIGITA